MIMRDDLRIYWYIYNTVYEFNTWKQVFEVSGDNVGLAVLQIDSLPYKNFCLLHGEVKTNYAS